MGKKYIVNLMDETQIIVEVGANSTGAALIASNPISALTPYTEPDIEQVRKEAYQKGYETGYEDGYNEPGKNKQEAYQRGLADAWEAARKISLAKIDGGFSWESMNNMFGTDSPSKIYKTFTASEAIEKIRQYEQEHEEIKAGDEVENTQTGVKFIVTHIWFNNHGEKGVSGFNHNCSAFSTTIELVKKTGRHFPEIAAVLEKMRGEQDG